MRRWFLVFALAAAFAAIAYAVLGSSEPRRPRPLPEQEEAPEPRPVTPMPLPPTATVGTFVVRLKFPEGTETPPNAMAGYRRFGTSRLRPASADGTYRFSDAPVGLLDAVADVEGFEADPVTVMLVAGTPTEAVIVLRRIGAPTK